MEFLENIQGLNGIVGAMLSLIHPEVYDAHVQVLLEMYRLRSCLTDPNLTDTALRYWQTPFSAFAVIANRETEFHRDTKGGRMLPDVLSVHGSYCQGRLEVPLLGARFVYNPGTSVVFPGYLMEHGASKTDGERVCIANFLRPQVGYSLLENNPSNPYREAAMGPPTVEYLSKIHKWGEVKERADIW